MFLCFWLVIFFVFLSLITDGKFMLSAKRTSILKYDDGFYKGWQLVVGSEKQKIINTNATLVENSSTDISRRRSKTIFNFYNLLSNIC